MQRVWLCCMSKLTCVFWGGHFTGVHTFYEWNQFFLLFFLFCFVFIFPKNLGFFNLVLKIIPPTDHQALFVCCFIWIHLADDLKRTAIQRHNDYCGTLVTVWSSVGLLVRAVKTMLIFHMKCTGCWLFWTMLLTSPLHRITIICNKSLHVTI